MYFVQHGSYAAQAQKLLGKEVVDEEYPMDHTHTAPFLADVVRDLLSPMIFCFRFFPSILFFFRSFWYLREYLTNKHNSTARLLYWG